MIYTGDRDNSPGPLFSADMNMMKGKRSLLFLAILLLFLAGCGLGTAQIGRKPSPDWSRGLPVSTDAGGTIDMLVEGSGQAVHFVWPTAADDQAHIHYTQLDNRASPVVDKDLILPEGRQRTPRLLDAGPDKLHLFWARRISSSKGWVLWHALLDKAGNVIGEPTQITPEEVLVGDYAAAQNAAGEAFVVWEDNRTNSLSGARVTDRGVEPESALLVESGESPSLYVDQTGTLHMAWFEELGISYATFPDGELALAEATSLAQMQELTAILDGPAVGVAGDWVYVIWSTFARSGLESNTGWTEYVAFPAGEPGPSNPTRVWMLTDEEQPYEPYTGAYPLTVLAPQVNNPAISSDYIVEPDRGASQGDELAVVLSTKQEFRLQELVQLAVAIFKDGEYAGYQMASKTESFSQDGSLFTDAQGNLHLAWLEGTGRKVYYASTAPETRAGIDRLGAGDLANALLSGGMEAMVGTLFFPLALIWFVPGAIILAVYKLRQDDETASDPTSRILIIIAVVGYLGTKALFLPSIISYVPFSAWIDVPNGLALVLRIIVPLFILALGILVAEWLRRRRPTMSSVMYYFILCGVDALLTLAVYGVNYLGVF